jgi:Flp pilus assembly CpaF family ATPase
MVNSLDYIYVERRGVIERTTAQFMSVEHLRRVVERIVGDVGRRIDESSPMVDARLPDGSRVNAIVPPLAVDGPALTIRKFAADPFQVDDLIGFGTLTPEVAELLDAVVRAGLNILVSGGTGTGKTTLLNVVSSFIPASERIVTIEDAVELQLRQPHVIRLESRPPNIEGRGEVTVRDLVRNSLRMRPDRIIVGEVRGAEALDMLQAMNTGHDGSISTIHCNSPRDAFSRLETMVLMAGSTSRAEPFAIRSPQRSTSSSTSIGCPTARARSRRSPRSPAWRATSSQRATSTASATELPASTPLARFDRSARPASGRRSRNACRTRASTSQRNSSVGSPSLPRPKVARR